MPALRNVGSQPRCYICHPSAASEKEPLWTCGLHRPKREPVVISREELRKGIAEAAQAAGDPMAAVYEKEAAEEPLRLKPEAEAQVCALLEHDSVNHPKHYTSHPSGVECIQIVEHMTFCTGNAVKYLWRAGLKEEANKEPLEKRLEDLRKAAWYINREIERLTK